MPDERARFLYERGIRYWSEGRQQEALEQFEAALAIDAGIAELPYQEGLDRARAGEIEGAEGWLWIAHLFRPEHVETLTCLGDVLRRLGRVDEALPLLEQGAALAAESWEVHSDLGLALCEVDRIADAAAAIERAVQLHGISARLAANLAVVRRCEGRFEEALALLDFAIAEEPEMLAAHVNRAHLLLLTGRFEEGWPEYEWRPQKRLAADRRLAEHDWAGKKVLLHQEQGAGDLIQFARYAGVLAQAGAKVIVACDERFVSLMRCVAGVADAIGWSDAIPTVELEANVMSLPGILKVNAASLPMPYMELEPERVNAWKQRLGGERRLRVGLVWGGNPANPVERRRRIALTELAPMLENQDVAFYSLQQGPQRAELAGMAGVVDLAGECEAVTEAAAAIANLDLVITTDTMPAHLAGALGRPVWVLLSYTADWRWGVDREDSHWYPSMRLFRQRQLGDWSGVVERAGAALNQCALLRLNLHLTP